LRKFFSNAIMDKEKLKNLDKLPPDIKRQFALYMNKWKEKKKETRY